MLLKASFTRFAVFLALAFFASLGLAQESFEKHYLNYSQPARGVKKTPCGDLPTGITVTNFIEGISITPAFLEKRKVT